MLLFLKTSNKQIDVLLVGAQGPGAETPSKVTSGSVQNNFLAGTSFDIKFLDIVSPGVESTSSLHVNRPFHKVSHNLV
jgi:hypothetical protein